jgi:hypothetical protein
MVTARAGVRERDRGRNRAVVGGGADRAQRPRLHGVAFARTPDTPLAQLLTPETRQLILGLGQFEPALARVADDTRLGRLTTAQWPADDRRPP